MTDNNTLTNMPPFQNARPRSDHVQHDAYHVIRSPIKKTSFQFRVITLRCFFYPLDKWEISLTFWRAFFFTHQEFSNSSPEGFFLQCNKLLVFIFTKPIITVVKQDEQFLKYCCFGQTRKCGALKNFNF